MTGHVFLLIGPSGSGKTTLIREICRLVPSINFIPTTTTRPPRPDETDGREYFFVTAEQFKRLVDANKFFEWKEIHGNRYGTPKERIKNKIAAGELGIMSVDILGGLEIRRALPATSTAIFVRPTSTEDLAVRLHARDGSSETDAAIRLQRVEQELALADHCDYTIINDNGHLAQAIADILAIIRQQVVLPESAGPVRPQHHS